jgi:hypothetical protein
VVGVFLLCFFRVRHERNLIFARKFKMWLKSKGFADKVKQWWDSYLFQGTPSLVGWFKVCTPISKGGLGFRSLLRFNHALLGK